MTRSTPVLLAVILASCTTRATHAPAIEEPAVPPPEAHEPAAPADISSVPQPIPPAEQPAAPPPDVPPAPRTTPAAPNEADIRRMLARAVSPLTLVLASGRAALLLEDLDRDGTSEILTVAANAGPDVSPRSLADHSSLFSAGRQPVRFFLVVLGLKDGELEPLVSVDLGERMVFGSITPLALTASRAESRAVVAAFHTRQGVEQRWVLFDGKSVRPSSTFDLRETLESRPRVEDIDRNGVVDIVVQERGLEEGIGYETFLTWYRWNGTRFVEQTTINVVRNLQTFLARTKELLLARRWADLLAHCFSQDQVRLLRRRGLSVAEVLVRGLGLDAHYDPAIISATQVLEDIADVVMPHFLENPFTANDERGSYFLLAFRTGDAAGASRVVEAPLYMPRNPFGPRQFFLLIR